MNKLAACQPKGNTPLPHYPLKNLPAFILSFFGPQPAPRILLGMTEISDWSNPQGRLFTQMLGAFAEYYSGALSTHVKKGIGERARLGLHLGAIPFGYESCWESVKGEKQLRCKPEHPGGVHVHPKEGAVVRTLFNRYAGGRVTLSQLAAWLNRQGYRTRNVHRFPDSSGKLVAKPRLFTTA